MTTQKVTLVIDCASADGTLFTRGSVRVLPSFARLGDPADLVLIEQAPARVSFTGCTTAPSLDLFPCDLIGPQGVSAPAWAYTVYYDGCPGNPQPWSFQLLSTGGTVQRLSSYAASPVAQSWPGVVTTVNGKTGTVTLGASDVGALPLPTGTAGTGQVPVASGAGSASAWTTLTAADVGAASTAALAAEASARAAADAQFAGSFGVIVAAPTGVPATDTASWQAAITSLASALSFGAAVIQAQAGTYVVNSNSLVIRNLANFAVRGSGTVIKQAPNTALLPNNTAGDLLIGADCADVWLDGITVDGDRDNVAPVTPLTATAASGQPSVTVASGNGARYQAGQVLTVNGGLGSADQSLFDKSLTIASITAGGGSGGGDLVTFTANLAHSYGVVSSTLLSDGFGPYGAAGAYLIPYQAGIGASVAGRTLTSENQQNGLHLLNCQRVTVTRCTARNVWESPFKLGTGFLSTSLTDGCRDVTFTGCQAYHGFDQGYSAWLSSNVTVTGCVADAAGWAGISFTSSGQCAAVGNVIRNSVYRVWGDSTGHGIVTEGGAGNAFAGNVISGVYGDGIKVTNSPLLLGMSQSSPYTLGAYLPAATAAGTSVQVSASTNFQVGATYSIIDAGRTEQVTIASRPDGTHVTFTAPTRFSHASGIPFLSAVAEDTTVTANRIYGPQTGSGISAAIAVRSTIKANVIAAWSLASGVNVTAGVNLSYAVPADQALPSGSFLAGQGSVIEGNVIGGGASPSILADSTGSLTIALNELYGAANSSNVIQLNGVTDSKVIGNQVSDSENNVGIITAAGGQSGAACARLTIALNTVRRCFKEGMRLTSGDSLKVIGNDVSSCGGNAGIDLRGITRSVVADNTANSNQASGILLEDNGAVFSQYNRVHGNTCRDDGAGVNVQTGGTWTQQYGIRETGSSNNNLYWGNECDSNGTGQLVTAGAASYAWASVISASPSGSLPLALGGTGAATAPAAMTALGGMSLVAVTPVAGYTLVNGTGAIISWTAPSDGALHRVLLNGCAHVTSAETGGNIGLAWTLPDGTSESGTVIAGGSGTGLVKLASAGNGMFIVQAGSTVTLSQTSALTGGAAVAWAELWAL